MARILLVAASYPPRIGGYERQVDETRRILARLGHEVHVLACQPRTSSTVTGPRVQGVPSRFLLGDSFPVPPPGAVARAVRTGRWDLVITNTRFFLPTFQAARAAHRAGVPYVHVEHGSAPLHGRHPVVDAVAGAFDRTAGRWVVQNAAATVGVSQASARFLRRLGAVDPVTIGNAIPFDDEAAVERRLGRLVDTLGTKPVVSVGRLVPNKGLAGLVDAAARMPAASRPHLRFIGDGPQREALRARAAAQGVALDLPGAVPSARVRDEFLAAGLACQPSLDEGFGLAVLEAVACGTPVVASDCAAHRELLDEGRLGLLHKAGDPDDLAAALSAAREDPAATVARARHAFRTLRGRCGPDQAVTAWARLLEGLALPATASAPLAGPDKTK